MGKSHDLATIADDGITSLDIGSGGLTVGTDQFAVDASGRVTMPYQPSFKVALSANFNTSSAQQKVTGWSSASNVGNSAANYSSGHFNNNRFTAPVAGKYLMSYEGLHDTGTTGTTQWIRFYFYINGSVAHDGLGPQGTYSSYDRVNGSVIFDLNVNDYVEVYADDAGGNGHIYSSYTTWSGHLLG